MAAGQGFKTFATGDVLSAADVNGYLMQGVLVFADSAERDAEITSPEEGQFAYLKDTNVTTYYTGSAWANLDTTGMTNPMTTTGDTIYSSSGSTPARLGIGSTGQVLTVAGGVPSWATPAGGSSGLTYLAGGSFSAVSSVSLAEDIISDTYPFYRLAINFTDSSAGGDVLLRQRQNGSDYTSNYYGGGSIVEFSNTLSQIPTNNASAWDLNSAGPRIGFVIDLIGWRTATPKFAASGVFSSSAQGGGTLGGFCLGSGTPDSVSFVSSTGTFTGTYAFYGFANS
jgi:hypothetical protein